jgi:hypothetical protein
MFSREFVTKVNLIDRFCTPNPGKDVFVLRRPPFPQEIPKRCESPRVAGPDPLESACFKKLNPDPN